MGANVCQHVALRVSDLDRAARFYIDNWRWHGVPIYLRSGKALW